MAAAQTPPLRLTRDQLASFLQDQKQIKAFENLFAIVEAIAPDLVQQVLIAAGTAQASATQAQDQVQAAEQALAASQAATDAKASLALQQIPDVEQALATMLAACEAKATLALQQVLALKHIADLVETAPPPRERKRTRYGQFWDTTTQTALAANTAYPVTFNNSDTLNSGVRLRSPSTSEVQVDTEGLYNFQISVQLDTTSGGTDLVWIWFRKNGFDIADSACQIQIQGNNAELLQSFNLFVDMKAGDWVEVMWATDDTAAQLAYFASAAFHPAVPSIILTVSNNIRGEL
jgi:hypothetical protein